MSSDIFASIDANKATREYLFIMILLIDLTPYSMNMENKILLKRLYIKD